MATLPILQVLSLSITVCSS